MNNTMINFTQLISLVVGNKGSNYSSMGRLNPTIAAIVAAVFLLFVLYVVIRVRKALKTDGRQTKREAEKSAYKELYRDNFDDREHSGPEFE
jgi:hypothetical protein